jgi:hypothetical protein
VRTQKKRRPDSPVGRALFVFGGSGARRHAPLRRSRSPPCPTSRSRVYTREPGGILIEIATDTGTPFPVEEAAAGRLTLPPRLEGRRDEIEARLAPIDDAG